MTARTGQGGRRAWIGQQGQYSRDRTAQRTVRTAQPVMEREKGRGLDSQNMQHGQGSLDRTTEKGQPGHHNRSRTAMSGQRGQDILYWLSCKGIHALVILHLQSSPCSRQTCHLWLPRVTCSDRATLNIRNMFMYSQQISYKTIIARIILYEENPEYIFAKFILFDRKLSRLNRYRLKALTFQNLKNVNFRELYSFLNN